MKKLRTALAVSALWAVSTVFNCYAEEAKVDPVANEKKVLEEFKKEFSADRVVKVDKLKDVVAAKAAGTLPNTYILDLRTAQEFYTFHIEGADHIHAGHVYLIPKMIPDVNSEIYLVCRTAHRAYYVGHLLRQYGYTNLWAVDGGMVEWLKAGYPVVNQYMGRFVAKYEDFQKDYDKDFRDKNFKVREFHPF